MFLVLGPRIADTMSPPRATASAVPAIMSRGMYGLGCMFNLWFVFVCFRISVFVGFL